MAQAFAGRTPKGHELYREVGGDHWFVREPVKSPGALKALNTVRDLHRRRPIGRFGSFTEAATYMDSTTNG